MYWAPTVLFGGGFRQVSAIPPPLNDPARVPKLPGDCSDAWRAVRGHVALAFVDDVHALCVTGSVPRFSFFERTRNCSSSLTILIVCVYKLFTILKKNHNYF